MSNVILNSISSCQKAYINYHCEGNSMNVTKQEMCEIVRRYGDYLGTWQKVAEATDRVKIEFNDSDFEDFYNNGWDEAKNDSGGDDNQTSETINASANLAVQAGAIAVNTVVKNAMIEGAKEAATEAAKVAAEKVIEEGAKKAAEETVKKGIIKTTVEKAAEKTAARKAAEEVAKKATEEAVSEVAGHGVEEATQAAAKEAAKKAAQEVTEKAAKASAYIAITMGVIAATQYWLTRPNKDNYEAVMELRNEMLEGSNQLERSKADLKETNQKKSALHDRAYNINQTANDEIEDKQTQYQTLERTFETLDRKNDSGKQLSSSEASLYKESAKVLNETGKEIKSITASASAETKSIQADVDGLECNYSEIAANMAEVKGKTDFAAEVDKATKTLCIVEGTSQALNAAQTTAATVRLGLTGGLAWWNWVIVAAGGAAAAASGVASLQQFSWAKNISEEMSLRSNTQNQGEATKADFDIEVAGYKQTKATLETLSINEPNEGTKTFDATIKENNNCNQYNDPNNKMKKGNKNV